MIERECRDCGTAYQSKTMKSTRQCRECRTKDTMRRRRENWTSHKSKRLLYKYGISWDEYTTMGAKQDWKCACCSSAALEDAHGYPLLCVDHNHETGNVRGLLCDFCNKAIGLMKDDIAVLKNAITYLKTYEVGHDC